MPKKRVSVTLRKPGSPRAPEAANVPAAPEASAVESVASRVAEASEASAIDNVVVRAAEPPAESVVIAHSVEVDTAAVESAVLRAAEVPLPPSTVEAFVNGAAAAREKAATETPAQLEKVLSRGPAGYRELTIYLPEKLAEELTVHCLERNLDLNRLIATAVEQLLRLAHAVPEPVNTPEPSARKSRRSRLLSLAAWVRAVLVARRPSWLLGNPSSVSTS
jgi:hypothetical protein